MRDKVRAVIDSDEDLITVESEYMCHASSVEENSKLFQTSQFGAQITLC